MRACVRACVCVFPQCIFWKLCLTQLCSTAIFSLKDPFLPTFFFWHEAQSCVNHEFSVTSGTFRADVILKFFSKDRASNVRKAVRCYNLQLSCGRSVCRGFGCKSVLTPLNRFTLIYWFTPALELSPAPSHHASWHKHAEITASISSGHPPTIVFTPHPRDPCRTTQQKQQVSCGVKQSLDRCLLLFLLLIYSSN